MSGSIYKREGSTNWWLRYRSATGKIVRRSAATTDKSIALMRLAQELAKDAGKLPAGSTGSSKPKGLGSKYSLETRIEILEKIVEVILMEKEAQIRFRRGWRTVTKGLLEQ